MRLLVVALLFLSAVGVLVGVSLGQSSVPVMTQSELLSDGSRYEGGAVILDGSRIVAIESLYPLTFEVAPEGVEETLKIVSKVSPPDNFRLENPVRVWGTFDREKGVFEAYQVTTQCPSRYKATEEAKKKYAEGEREMPVPGSASEGP